MPDISEFLTRREAADVAHAAIGTIDRWLREPDGPPSLKIGSRILIPRAGFLAWLLAHPKGSHQ